MPSIQSTISVVVFGLSLLSSAAPLDEQVTRGVDTQLLNVTHISARHTAGHQDPEKKIHLYHGTPMTNLKTKMTDMAKDWPPTAKGDLNRDGALYLTDSFRAAAQWACYGKSTSDEKEGGVIEYEWNGPSAEVYPYSKWGNRADYENYVSAVFHSTLVHSIAPDEKDRKKYMELRKAEVNRLVKLSREYDMFEGPMDTAQFPKITNGFWQYAVVKKTAFEKDVKMVAGYKVDCSKIPATKNLPLDDTQGPVAKFSKEVTEELALEKVEV